MINNIQYDKLLNKINDLNNKFNKSIQTDISNNILDSYKLLIEMRIYHGFLIEKIFKKQNTNRSTKKYFTLSVLNSLSNNINNIINTSELKFKEIFSNKNLNSIKNINDDIFNNILDDPLLADTEQYHNDNDNKIDDNDNDNKDFKKLNILIYFYLPSCGYCVEFNKYWEALKEHCNENKIKINLVKIDCSDNNNSKLNKMLKMFNVNGFPSIYFVNKKMTSIKIFDEDRTPDNLINFIKKNNRY